MGCRESRALSHVDVDTDSDNTGAVENTPYEDNIEMNQPGKVIGYNKDDDNGNGVADYQDSTAAVGGDWDLNRSVFSVNWNFASLQGFTFQWVTTGPVKIWQDVVKTPMPTTFAWGDPLSSPGMEFWVEGTGIGAATVELKMLRPGGALHQSDKVRFTVVDFDLDTDSDNNGTINGSLAEDRIEMDAPGKMLRHNRDDDNGNGQADRLDPPPFVNAQGAPMNDDDLVPVAITLDSGGVSLTGWTVTLTRGAGIRVWGSQGKLQTTSFNFTVGGGANPLPSTLWVDGHATGQSTVNVALYSPSSWASLSDDVLFTSMYVDLIAYRPQTEGPEYGAPFAKTVVTFAQEISPGVGIRANGDDDDGDGTADRSQTTSTPGENDLIEVAWVIDPPRAQLSGVEVVLTRSNNAIRVWGESNRSVSVLNSASAVLDAQGNDQVWVEWKGAVATASSTFKLQARATNTQATPLEQSDSLKFFPFRSVVIALGGNLQDPSDPADPNHGAFQIAIDLYRDAYDAHMYRESDASDSADRVYNEIVNAVTNRGVTQIAILAYSQGGGQAYDLSQRLNDNTATSGLLVYTAYMDAVESTGGTPESRRPVNTDYHVNYWQPHASGLLWLHGAATATGTADFELDVRTTAWGASLDHFSIDDHVNVRDGVKNRLRQNTIR